MKSTWNLVGLLGAIGLVSGCAIAPRVELTKISDASELKDGVTDSYFLQKSIIKVDKTGTKKGADGVEIDDLEINSIPEEYTDFKIAIRRADQIGTRTNLNITKIANTDLIKEAGVEVIDNRVDLISKIGTIATSLVAIAFDKEQGLSPSALPKVIKVSVLLKSNKVGAGAKENVDADGATIDFGPVPPDALPITTFTKPIEMSGIIYSACRQATIKFQYKDRKYEKTVKVSDPNFYQRIAFPVKGKISFHSECGVSVESNKDTGVSSNAAIVDALVAQGKAIKDAIEAAQKESEDNKN